MFTYNKPEKIIIKEKEQPQISIFKIMNNEN